MRLRKFAIQGDSEGVQALLAAGVEVDARDICQETPLMLAAKEGHVAVVRLLLDHGAEVNAWNITERTPLMFAAWKGCESCVRLLLEAGADVDTRDELHATPLLFAVWKGRESCIRLLLDAGTDLFRFRIYASLKEEKNVCLQKAERLFSLANASGSLPPEMLLLIFSAASHMTEDRWLEVSELI